MITWTRSSSCQLSQDGRFRITRLPAGHMLEDRGSFAGMNDGLQAAKDAAGDIVYSEEAAARRSRAWKHLAFTGAKYAMCGSTVNDRNPATHVVADADCPDCVREQRNAEFAADVPHQAGLKPDYER